MGNLFYGNTPDPIEMPDRLLSHMKVVVATKLRRGESFTLTLRHPEGAAAGRTTIWMQPAIPAAVRLRPAGIRDARPRHPQAVRRERELLCRAPDRYG